MQDHQDRTCNECKYEIAYWYIWDAHDPEPSSGFQAIALKGKLKGKLTGTKKCPQCDSELTMESTRKIPKVTTNKPHECYASEVNLPRVDIDLATKVRQSCIDQKDVWQLIPNLKLEAEGRSGWLDNASLCYEKGLWLVGSSQHGRTDYAVECLTGHLIRVSDFLDKQELHFLDDVSVVSLGLELEFDAQIVVDDFRSHIQEYENPPSYYSDEQWEKNRKWREEVRKKHDLRESFYREEIVICGCKNCERILTSLS